MPLSIAKNNDPSMAQKIRVLIADDSEDARAGLRALLSTWGEIEIVGEAATGQEALDLAATEQPDVVLIDMQMPIMDGVEATRLIKARFPTIGVIVLTMYSAYRTKAMAAGADAFFSKTALPDEWLPLLHIVATDGSP